MDAQSLSAIQCHLNPRRIPSSARLRQAARKGQSSGPVGLGLQVPTNLKPLHIQIYIYIYNYRMNFRSQTSDSMQRWKSSGKSQDGEVKKWEDKRWRKSEERRCRCRKKVGKSRFTVFFPMIWGSGGSKSNLAKAAGAEPAGQMRDEKLHAVVARSTFPSQKAKNTPRSDHF